MANLNRDLLIGRCTRDPDLRYTPKGTAVADLDIAINRMFKGEDGETKEETVWVSITAWGRTAEVASQYLRKGSSLFVEGRLSLDVWDDKQTGQKRSRLRVVAEHLQLLDRKQDSAAQPPRSGPPARRDTAPPVRTPTGDPDLDAEPLDIPF